MIKMAVSMFEPRSLKVDMSRGSGVLCREQIIIVIGVAARENELGWQAIRAEHSSNKESIQYLKDFLRCALATHTEQCATLPDMALSVYLQRPVAEQLESVINSHPLWDRERRRAAKVKVLIDKALSCNNNKEAERLAGVRAEILQSARARCEREIMETGRCPRCNGSGRMLRKDADCSACNAQGRIVPDLHVIEKYSNYAALCAVNDALSFISDASARFVRDLKRLLDAEREAA